MSIPSTKEELKQPKLRFPEFEGDWEVRKAEAIISLISGNHLKPSEYNLEKKGLPYYTGPSDIYSYDKYSESSTKIVELGDVLITVKGSSTGTSVYYNGKNAVIGRQLMAAKANSNCNGFFLSLLIKKKEWTLKQLSIGNMIPGISRSDILTLIFKLPSLPEQQKIASFLSAIDQKRQILAKQKTLWTQYKKGMMQQLFSQQIRFKQESGEDFADWETRKLVEFLQPILRQVPKPSDHYLAIGVRSHGKGTFQKPNTDPNSNVMEKLYLVRANDLIVNITFAWEGAIAIVKEEDDGGYVSHRFPTYNFDEEIMLCLYFKYVIIQKAFRFNLDLISPGGAGRNRVLSKKEFLKMKCSVPSIPEQQKIASFLNSIDQKIQALDRQVALMDQYKRALLQQLFC